MEQTPPRSHLRGANSGVDRGESFSLPYGVADGFRATSVKTPSTVRAKLAFGRNAPLRATASVPETATCTRFRESVQPRLPWNKHPHEVTYGGQTRAWTEARVSVSHTGSRTDSAPPASKRRVRSGPNLHSGETHHCVRRPLCPRPQLVHDSAKVCSLVLFPGRLRPDPGVGTCMEQNLNPLIPG